MHKYGPPKQLQILKYCIVILYLIQAGITSSGINHLPLQSPLQISILSFCLCTLTRYSSIYFFCWTNQLAIWELASRRNDKHDIKERTIQAIGISRWSNIHCDRKSKNHNISIRYPFDWIDSDIPEKDNSLLQSNST